MEILVLGGDLRYLEIIERLSLDYSVSLVGYTNTYINDRVKNVNIDDIDVSRYGVIIFPVNGVMDNNLVSCRFSNNPIKLSDNFLIGTRDDVLIFSGVSTPSLTRMLDIAGKECVYLMSDRSVIKENAIPTVEGIIADVIVNTEKTLNDSSVLVFGYGNVGSVLVKSLNLLGANVSVAVIEERDKLELDDIGIDCFYSFCYDDLIDKIRSADIIINTVPKTIIDNDDLKYINRDAYVLDIASHPHGIDREVLDELFVKNKLYLGIPGRVAPKTSGKILTKKIKEVMEGN